MKKIFFILFISLFSLGMMAQRNHTREFDKKLFEAKAAEMIYRLGIDDNHKKPFTVIYEQYSRDMLSVWNKYVTTSTDETERMKMNMRRQEEAQGIRLRYADKLATVLSSKQVKQFFDVEKEIQKRLKNRATHKHNRNTQKNKK